MGGHAPELQRALKLRGRPSLSQFDVLPTFMRYSRSLDPESIANKRHAIQIVDTLKSMDLVVITSLAGV